MAKDANANDHSAHGDVARCGGSSPHQVHASKLHSAAGQIYTLAPNAVMVDDDGSNNTSLSVGVGNCAGRSPNSTLLLMEILRSFRLSKSGNPQLVFTGDFTQLPAFSEGRWHTFPFRRFPSASGPPLLLEEQWRQRSGFSTLS